MKWDRSKGRPEPIRALNKVLEIDNREPLVDLRVACPSIKLPRQTTIPFVRSGVAELLEKAAAKLPKGVYIGVTDAWRPFERQAKIYEWVTRCLREAHPDITYVGLRRRACRWVAPIDQKAPPGHCTGAAVDIVLVNDAMEELDLISPYPRFSASPTYVYGLSETAHSNRMMMANAMLDAGFSNCRDEYWHYSYGDAGWAVRMGLTDCFYGLIELPEEHWRSKQVEWEAALLDRPNPFLRAAREEHSAIQEED